MQPVVSPEALFAGIHFENGLQHGGLMVVRVVWEEVARQ